MIEPKLGAEQVSKKKQIIFSIVYFVEEGEI